MPRLITEWSTRDPKLAEMLREIARFPERSVERLELEAILHTQQAAWCHREIGRIREFESRHRGGGRRAVRDAG
jgi:hypothetical protein